MTLTPSQQIVFDQFVDFVNSDEQVFLLKGSAGTGKTTMLKAIIDSLKDQWRYVLMAPTGRASYILGKKTDYPASTIHRKIYEMEEGLKDDGSGKMIFSPRKNEDEFTKTIYFVDEASLISNVNSENELYRFGSGFLLNDLMKYCGDKKIVFVGDYAQLPPIGQNISPALSAEYLKEHFNVSCKEVYLKEVVRQVADSSILINATSIRDSIENNVFNTFQINDGADVIHGESLLNDYNKLTSGNVNEDAVIIAYSNSQVLDYNLAIRKNFFPNNFDERVLPGELLLVSQNNYFYEEELFNGTIVKVVDANPNGMVERRKVRYKSSEKDEKGETITKEMELVFRNVRIETPSHKQIDCIILDNFLTDKTPYFSKDYHQALMADFNIRMQGMIRGEEERRQTMRKDKYVNALVCRYGYAITCHKAQGGEWKYVFADMSTFGGKLNSGYFRWAYTAITRSNGTLWHYASPSFNAISDLKKMTVQTTDKIPYYVPEGENFLDWHYRRINELCEAYGIECSENRNVNYQHLIDFKKGELRCRYQIWYKKDGYGTRRNVMSANDDVFSKQVTELVERSLIPENLNYHPQNDFSQKLHEFVLEITSELNVPILNIFCEQWKNIYVLRTLPYESIISFFYNSKGKYTTITSNSTGGVDDSLLMEILNRFK